jgi:hypothetical protein
VGEVAVYPFSPLPNNVAGGRCWRRRQDPMRGDWSTGLRQHWASASSFHFTRLPSAHSSAHGIAVGFEQRYIIGAYYAKGLVWFLATELTVVVTGKPWCLSHLCGCPFCRQRQEHPARVVRTWHPIR